jgi:hypothetical protein
MEEPFEIVRPIPLEPILNKKFARFLIEAETTPVPYAPSCQVQISCVFRLELIQGVRCFPAMNRHARNVAHLKQMIVTEWIDFFAIDPDRIV